MNNLEELLARCRDALSKGDIACALDAIGAVIPESDRSAHNEVLLHRSRLVRIEDQERKNVGTASEIQRNQLLEHVAQFLDEVIRKLPQHSSTMQAVAVRARTDASPGDHFDAFLSHNSKDKATVRHIARTLEARGLRLWLDEDDLPPGQPWIPRLEQNVIQARAVVVLLGTSDIGSWQKAEVWLALRNAFERGQAVVPVWLPGVTKVPDLAEFLTLFTWVDFSRGVTNEGIDRLIWAITGTKPDPA